MITTCPICGKSLKEGEIFCKNCEALLSELSDDDTDSGQLSKNKMTNFTQNAISKREETWQEKFLTAKGRLNRKPYILRGWFLSCTPYIGGFLLGIMAGPAVAENVVLGLQILFALPCLLLIIRRLHDIGRSGWWWLLIFIPFVNFIMGIYLMCKKGETGPNRFGPDPLQQEV